MVDGKEIKLVAFADDMTSFVRDKSSHTALFDTLSRVARGILRIKD